MKKYVLTILLFSGFAIAQDSMPLDISDGSIITPSAVEQAVSDQGGDTEIARRWRSVRCGRHSDYKCMNRRAYDSCEKDSSHGYYGRCYNVAQRGPEVVCHCR